MYFASDAVETCSHYGVACEALTMLAYWCEEMSLLIWRH